MTSRRIAYLVNQYPKTSHSFVRREIHALERLGWSVQRYSIRKVREPLVEQVDREERERTLVLLDLPLATLVLAVLSAALLRPHRFAAAGWLALGMLAKTSGRRLRPLGWWLVACVLLREVRRAGIERVHAHFGTNSAAVAMLCEALGGPPYSFTAHGTESFDAPPAISLPLKIHRARFVATVSEYGRSQLMRWCPRNEWPKLHVVRCGLAADYAGAPVDRPPSAKRLACVARLSPEKGLFVLVEALARLAAEGQEFELALVGDGPLRADLEAFAEQRGVAQHIRFVGWGDSALVQREIRSARALVTPSLAEGLPVVIMEAFALHRPVIASEVGGIGELVETGETGWLVAPGSAEALLPALRACLAASPDELAALAARGAERVRQLHNVDEAARQLSALFQTTSERAA